VSWVQYDEWVAAAEAAYALGGLSACLAVIWSPDVHFPKEWRTAVQARIEYLILKNRYT
jgi:hypothetical protein